MKLKKIAITLIILSTLLIITGCTPSKKTNNEIKMADVYKGTGGLDFEFLKDSPPNELYSNQSFQIITLIKNKGAYPIDDAKLILSYDTSDFYIKGSKETQFMLNGKNIYNVRNDEIIKSFYAQAIPLLPNSEYLQSTILASACYTYKNKLSTDVCIDMDSYNLKLIEKACKTRDQSFSGQGGPVGISRIEQKMLVTDGGVTPQFIIYLKNFGNGDVISKDKIYDMCGSQTVTREDLNTITLTDVSFSQYGFADMNCEPEKLRLLDNEELFICTLNSEIPKEESTYITNINVEFNYGYVITKSKDIIIKKMKSR